jgi:hypothetical protein
MGPSGYIDQHVDKGTAKGGGVPDLDGKGQHAHREASGRLVEHLLHDVDVDRQHELTPKVV